METKICHKCHQEKDVSEFPKNKSKKGGRASTCLICKRQYNRKHYNNNKQYYVDKAAKLKPQRVAKFLEFKTTLKCEKCGQNHPATLHFHHNDPSKKEKTISQVVRSWSIKRIMKEVEKCSVLCANCHSILHWESRKCDGNGTQPSEG